MICPLNFPGDSSARMYVFIAFKDHKIKDLLLKERRVAESQSTDVGWVDSF